MTRRMVALVWVTAILALISRVAYHFNERAGEVTSVLTLVCAVVTIWLFVRHLMKGVTR